MAPGSHPRVTHFNRHQALIEVHLAPSEGDVVQCRIEFDAERERQPFYAVRGASDRHADPSHTPGANALLAPFLTL